MSIAYEAFTAIWCLCALYLFGGGYVNDVNEVCIGFGVVAGLFSRIVGGFDTAFMCMIALMLLDMACGILSCVVFGKSRKTNGGLSSEVLAQGGVRKISELFVVCIGVVVDNVLHINYARNAVVMYFIATEALSILEHLAVMEVPLPDFIKKLLEILKDKNDKGELE